MSIYKILRCLDTSIKNFNVEKIRNDYNALYLKKRLYKKL